MSARPALGHGAFFGRILLKRCLRGVGCLDACAFASRMPFWGVAALVARSPEGKIPVFGVKLHWARHPSRLPDMAGEAGSGQRLAECSDVGSDIWQCMELRMRRLHAGDVLNGPNERKRMNACERMHAKERMPRPGAGDGTNGDKSRPGFVMGRAEKRSANPPYWCPLLFRGAPRVPVPSPFLVRQPSSRGCGRAWRTWSSRRGRRGRA